VDERLERGAVDLQDLVEAVDGRVGRRQRLVVAAGRDLLEDRGGLGGKLEQLGHPRGEPGGERMLAVEGGGEPDAVDVEPLGDLGEGELLAALGREDQRGDVGAVHGRLPWSWASGPR
jgi:hypothetical protein